jgi:hypothetical protein
MGEDFAGTGVLLPDFIHPMLELVHRGLVASTHPSATLTLLATSTSFVLWWIEVGTTKVSGGIVVRTIGFLWASALTFHDFVLAAYLISAGFAVGKKFAIDIFLFANPYLASKLVVTTNMPVELMNAMKAARVVIAVRTLQSLTIWLSPSSACDLCFTLDGAICTFYIHKPRIPGW